MGILSGYDFQGAISNRLGLPVDVVADTCYVQSISGETLQLYYWNASVLTIDAGQAAGVMVVAKFEYSGLCDALGSMIGNSKDTSIAFTTGTVLTTEVACDYEKVGASDNATLEEIATDLTADMANGEYCVDYRNGVLYGLKATTGVSDTVAYKVLTATTGGGTSVASSVNIAKIAGTALSDTNPMPVELTAVATTTGTDPFWDSDGDNTAQALKASAGNLFNLTVWNSNSAIAYVQLFDTAAGSVTVGTTPPIFVLPVPATGGAILDLVTAPLTFSTAITYACTTTATGNTDPTTGLEISGCFK